MSNKDTGCAPALAILLINFPLGILLHGLVMQAYWQWFIVPLGMPVIGFWHALGFAAFVGYLTFALPKDDDSKDKPLKDVAIRSFFIVVCKAGLFYGFGWAYHALMVAS